MSSQFENFQEIYTAAQEAPGVTLFTTTLIADAGTSMARIYTTHPEVFPIGGRKTLEGQHNPAWLDQVFIGQQPFLGTDKETLREFFFDSSLIESLGCGAIINVPVISNGATIGSMNFLAPEGSYDHNSVTAAVDIAWRSVQLMQKTLAATN